MPAWPAHVQCMLPACLAKLSAALQLAQPLKLAHALQMIPIDIYHGLHGLPCCHTQSIVVPATSLAIFCAMPVVLLLASWATIRLASTSLQCLAVPMCSLSSCCCLAPLNCARSASLSCLSSQIRMLKFVICPRWRARAKQRARGSAREQQAPEGQDSPKFHVVEMGSGCAAGLSCAGPPAQAGLTGTGLPAQADQDEKQQPGTPSEGGNAAARARTRCWQLSMLWLGGGLHTASPGKHAVGAAQGWSKPSRHYLAWCGFSGNVSCCAWEVGNTRPLQLRLQLRLHMVGSHAQSPMCRLQQRCALRLMLWLGV